MKTKYSGLKAWVFHDPENPGDVALVFARTPSDAWHKFGEENRDIWKLIDGWRLPSFKAQRSARLPLERM